MSHPLNDLVARPLMQLAEALAQLQPRPVLFRLLDPDLGDFLRRWQTDSIVRMALAGDCLRVIQLALGPSPQPADLLAFVHPLVRGIARSLVQVRPDYQPFSTIKKIDTAHFLAHHEDDDHFFGGHCAATRWLGLALSRQAAELGQIELLDRYQEMLLALLRAIHGTGPASPAATLQKQLKAIWQQRILSPVLPPPPQLPPRSPVRWQMNSPLRIVKLCLAPDGSRLALAVQHLDGPTPRQGLVLVDVVGRSVLAEPALDPYEPMEDLLFWPDGSRLAVCQAGTKRVLFCHPHSGVLLPEWETGTSSFSRLCVLPGGQTVLAECSGQLIRSALGSSDILQQIPVYASSYLGTCLVACAPDGKLAATVMRPGAGQGDNDIRLVDLETGKRRETLVGHLDSINDLAFSPWGRMLASAGGEGSVRFWDTLTAGELRSWLAHEGAVNALRFAPDGRTLLTGGTDKTVRVWSVSSGRELRRLKHAEAVDALSLSADGRFLAVGQAGTREVVLWDLYASHDQLEGCDEVALALGDNSSSSEDDKLERPVSTNGEMAFPEAVAPGENLPPQQQAELAAQALAEGQADQAIAGLESAIRRDPARSDPGLTNWYALRAQAYEAAGKPQPARALRAYELALDHETLTLKASLHWLALQLDPALAWAANDLAWETATHSNHRLRDATLAIDYARRASLLAEEQCWCFLDTLAAAYAAAEQFPEAVQTVQRALELAPEEEHDELRWRLERYQVGLDYEKEGEPLSAPTDPPLPPPGPLEAALHEGRFPEARLSVQQALEQAVAAGDPIGQAAALVDLGYWHLESQEPTEAEALLRQAQNLLREVSEAPMEPQVRAALLLGRSLVRQGQVDRGEKMVQLARQLAEDHLPGNHPLRAEVLEWIGRMCLEQERIGEAEILLRRSLKLFPLPDCQRTLAQVLLRLGRVEETYQMLLQALAVQERARGLLSRPLADTAAELAAVFQQMGRSLEAQALEQWVQHLRDRNGSSPGSQVDAQIQAVDHIKPITSGAAESSRE